MLHRSQPLVAVLLALLVVGAGRAEKNYVWLEGEKPSSFNIKPNIAGWGNKQFLSDGKWLQISVDADKVDKQVPGDGVLLGYDFNAPTSGKHEVWARIGYESVRSPFAWRINGGAWHAVAPSELTTDLMEISFFTEVAWLKLGEQRMTTGKHHLDIKLPKTKDDKGQRARILFACDALCLHPGTFAPNSKYKPDEDGRDDKDREAAQKVFVLQEPEEKAARTSVALAGLWEVTRHDEHLPGEVAAPIKDFPKTPHWKAIPVPSDKNKSRPDLLFAHRLWYRTRVQVPKSQEGRSFYLVFPENNLNTTVYVNGTYCGFDKNPFARVQIDVTRAVKPGVNEVWVGIKDAWYGYSANPDKPLKLRQKFNLPLDFSNRGFADLSYPIWSHFESGLLLTPEFVAAGPVYARDIFCKPSVARKELTAEITVANPSARDAKGEVVCEAVDAKSGKVAKKLEAQPFELAAGKEKTLTLSGKWADPKLWWPDEPNLYQLRTTIAVDGKTVDVADTTFGFREWTWQGKDFKLNGIPWHGWADTHTQPTKEEWVEFHRKTNQRFMRFWGTRWMDMAPEDALAFFDKNGIVVRRSGVFDGEGIGYMAIENDPDLRKKEGDSPIKMDLIRNWRDQIVAQVKGERNHPSVMIWSIENEYLYINCINLYGGLMDLFEKQVTETSKAVLAVDPTRPNMTDGGGACKANTMPVHGDHYTTGKFTQYPALAYTANVTGGGRGRWVWDQKRPRFIGEELFAQGHNPDYAYFGGEEVFVGQREARPAIGLFVTMLTEGYRWAGIGAVHFWQTQDAASGQYDGNAPRAVFCRQWDWTFASGQKVPRTLALFNDTHYDDPITFTWTLTVGGSKVADSTTTHRVAPGTKEVLDVTLAMPAVKTRTEGEWTLVLSVKGREVFRAVKPVSVLNTSATATKPTGIASLTASDLLVFDPNGSVLSFLKEREIPCTLLKNLKALPATGKVLIVGKDALDPAMSTASALAAYAAGGRRVIVLEQKHPLKYQGLPAAMEAAANEGRTAFGEDLEHPVLHGLKQKDFFTWGADEIVYRNAYLKPTRGGKSLVQCEERLQNTALAEVPVGEGLLLLSQLVVGEKLPASAVAQQLLTNLLDHAVRYQLRHLPVSAAVGDDARLAKTLESIGLHHTRAPSARAAIARPGERIAIVSATPANLKDLADHMPDVRRFTEAGGWIVLNGLTPDGLADYNKLVGFEHMIRPFRRERVTFPPARNRLTSGLTTGDIVLYSSKQIFPWQAGNYVVDDEFSYVVDLDDVAPFAKYPSDFHLNLVNGFVSADGWPLIVNVPAPDKAPLDWPLHFPREQELIEMEWIGNTFYWPVTKVTLLFDGKEGPSFATKPNNEAQVFAITPPGKGKDFTIRLAEWQKIAGKGQVTGADNIRLRAKRSPAFYKKVRPLLNIGAMVEYPQGKGGIILCNLRFKDTEEVPENTVKKQTILATLLRNLRAPFSGKTIIAGANLSYRTLDLSKQANQFRDEKGWFGDRNFTFKDLPTGKHTFAGVPFDVYDFATSPVPTVVMLGGPGLPAKLLQAVDGIPVNGKADALFFLHAARIDQRRNPQEIKDNKRFELFHYLITYADGKKLEVPVDAEIDVDEYRQEKPAALPGALTAWVRPYEKSNLSAVAYCKQWNNPRPNVAIRSVGLAYGKERRGVPVLLAVTAASAEK